VNFPLLILVFGVVFIAELPDKSMFASLTLSTRFRKSYVWLGAAAAFLVHVIIAVTAGHFLTLLPKQPLDLVVGGLFLVGAALLLFGKNEDESEEKEKLSADRSLPKSSGEFIKVFVTSFTVIFLGEWGDITQIATANYAAKYHNAIWSVAIGATLGLWTVAALGVFIGSRLLNRIPGRTVQRITGIILLLFAVISIWAGLR
jgi:putative Ca2+/H+ antiporter (TMEM165/GDT1 family)